MRLILVRHGSTFARGEDSRYVGVRLDPPLSEFGRAQARAAARSLKRRGLRPDLVLAGPQFRQQQTAAILAAGLKAPSAASSPALSEIDYGLWEGLGKSEIMARWAVESLAWKKDGAWPSSVFKGSFEETVARLRAWLSHLRELKRETVVAVSSQGTLRALYAAVDPEGWRKMCEAGQATDANVSHGAWSEVALEGAEARIVHWNVAPSFVDRLAFWG